MNEQFLDIRLCHIHLSGHSNIQIYQDIKTLHKFYRVSHQVSDLGLVNFAEQESRGFNHRESSSTDAKINNWFLRQIWEGAMPPVAARRTSTNDVRMPPPQHPDEGISNGRRRHPDERIFGSSTASPRYDPKLDLSGWLLIPHFKLQLLAVNVSCVSLIWIYVTLGHVVYDFETVKNWGTQKI